LAIIGDEGEDVTALIAEKSTTETEVKPENEKLPTENKKEEKQQLQPLYQRESLLSPCLD
jgi:hypothetical protein